jgi:hypothetical protein
MKTLAREVLLVDKDQAKLDLALEEETVLLRLLDPVAISLGLSCIPFRVEPTASDVRPVIRAATHFYWHLHRKSNVAGVIRKWVEVEFGELEGIGGSDANLDEILDLKGPNLIINDSIKLKVHQGLKYGIRLTNNSDMPLYPFLFFFINSDFSISGHVFHNWDVMSINPAGQYHATNRLMGQTEGRLTLPSCRAHSFRLVMAREVEFHIIIYLGKIRMSISVI